MKAFYIEDISRQQYLSLGSTFSRDWKIVMRLVGLWNQYTPCIIVDYSIMLSITVATQKLSLSLARHSAKEPMAIHPSIIPIHAVYPPSMVAFNSSIPVTPAQSTYIHDSHPHQTVFRLPATSHASYLAKGRLKIAGCRYRLAFSAKTRAEPAYRSFHRWL